MKRFFVNQLVIAALIVLATFTSCDKNNGNDEIETGNEYLIAGKYKSQTGSGDAVFYADYVTTTKSGIGVTSSTSEKELVGKIEDGDIIFNLSGIYNSESKQFYFSAGSSILVFQIVGTLSDKKMTDTQATVKVKTGDDWTVHTVSVTSIAPENVSIDGNASNTQVDGIPTSWFGKWKWQEDVFTMTAYQFVNNDYPDEPAGFLDIVPLSNGRYEMIWEGYVHYEVDGGSSWTTIEFCKIWLEASGQGLLLTIFSDSFSEKFAEAMAYNTATATADSKREITFTRP
jgi:hypothetical protein